MHLIFPETRVIGLHFCRCMYGSILHSNLWSGLQNMHLFCNRVRFGHSGSPKVDNFVTNWKRVCDFLWVCHCNYGPILHRFWDTANYGLKIAYFSYLSHSEAALRMLGFCGEVNHEETSHGAILQWRPQDRRWSYFDMIPDCDRRTDIIYHS